MSDQEPTPEQEPDWNFTGKEFPGDAQRLRDGIARNKEIDDRIDAASKEDRPIDLYRELQAHAAKAALRAYRKFNHTGRMDPKLTEVSREARQLTDRLIELIDREGAAAHAESFFAEVFGRVESFAPHVAESAKPLVAADS